MQCSSYTRQTLHPNIPSCSSLQDAISIIENDATLLQLKRLLNAHIKTIFSCHSCSTTPESLASSRNQIFLFKTLAADRFTAYPIIFYNDLSNSVERRCSNCQTSSKNIEMEVSEQIFIEVP